ncbi:MAG: SufS family cysteine desulfurase [Actinobacteria bacterium]|uniref:cysteine desulfurase n=1 Tax=freshwater metagenome TaxID=449393 RepID=A0A6J6EWJ2_9ZZZZ|nr:SufS family cysteine desulfurase [Actinomycetota bacterium]
MSFDLANKVRPDFPILDRIVRGGNALVYLDSAATSQKPNQVIDAEAQYYREINATIHRSGHELGELASAAYEEARQNIAGFVGAKAQNLIFTKNATEGLNLVAYAFLNATLMHRNGQTKYAQYALNPGDVILLTEMEHHANMVPWQHIAQLTGAAIKYIPVSDDGVLELSEDLFTNNCKIIAVTHQSNVLGTINDVAKIAEYANAIGAHLILDACQSVPHLPTNLENLNVAAAAWSGHKMLGPTGVGCLFLSDDLLLGLPPFLLGGNMIENVTFEKSTYRSDNGKFEAGTMNIAQVIGLSAAATYLSEIGLDRVHQHEVGLTRKALTALLEMPGIRVLGPSEMSIRGGLISFEVNGVHPHDVSQYLDANGIAIRAGHHCAWPLHRRLGAVASSRASFYLYNTEAEVEQFLAAVSEIRSYFKVA